MIFNLKVFFNLILCSFFLFPIGLTFLPSSLNSKIIMAVFGMICIFNKAQKSLDVDKDIFGIFVSGCLFSVIGLFSVLYNETNDYSYASYVLSMLVWIGAAYLFVFCLGCVHKKVTINLIVNYLLAVCLLQCFLALSIEMYYPLKYWVDSTIRFPAIEIAKLNEIDRLYGIGATLDPAGVRFAAVLVLTSIVIKKKEQISTQLIIAYIFSFLLLTGIGNLISRTTLVGTFLGICYLLFSSIFANQGNENRQNRIYITLFSLSFFTYLIGYLVYTYVDGMNDLIHYGFEAFFNFLEEGEFRTDSTDKLNTMWVFPDNLKTWIIGDGWFNDPYGRGFYKFTDIGYLRFIFYNGLVGLLAFSLYFIYITKKMSAFYPHYQIVFYLLLLLGFIIWIKVSTDLFQFYALFISLRLYTINIKST